MAKPIGDKVLIRPDGTDTVTAGGIIIPGTKVADTGTILAVSPDYDFEGELGVSLQEGDKVRYEPNRREEIGDGTLLLSAQFIQYKVNP